MSILGSFLHSNFDHVRAHQRTAGSISQKETSGSVGACAPEKHSLSCLPACCWNSPALFYPVSSG